MMKKILLSVFVIVIACTGSLAVFAETSSDYHNQYLKKKQEANQTQEQIDNVEQQIDKVLQEVVDLNNSILEYQTQIDKLNEQLDALETSISEKEKDLEEKKKILEERLVTMYMKKEKTFLDVVLSGNLMNFISNQKLIEQAANYDNKLITEVQELKTSLENEKNEIEKIKKEKTQKAKELESLKSEKQTKAANLSEEQKQLEEKLASQKAASEEFAKKERAAIAREEAARKAAQSNSNKSGSTNASPSISNPYSGGKLNWPCPSSSRITCNYGSRYIFGYREFHTGLDIGASIGTNIVAAESGTVIYTQTGYSQNLNAYGMASYGNMIIISHGNGLTTRYAHCNNVYVSVGQSVSRGEVIGAVGTTGCSTGPHVHFEVRENGSHKNPLNYL